MNKEKQKTKVFILGAGCSANYGHPLAKDFVTDLESFPKALGPDSICIKRCVEETVALMRQEHVQTLDDLAIRLDSGNYDDPSIGALARFGDRERRIQNAKIATAALLLSKELAAKKTGLKGYHDFLLEMCPGPGNWQQKLRNCNCRVISFNYDRLFEIAFLGRAAADVGNSLLYGDELLNSGFNHAHGRELGFASEGFCFLKMHGSVGARVAIEYGDALHYPYFDGTPGVGIAIKDGLFLPAAAQNSGECPRPLLVFPHEKYYVQSTGRPHHLYAKYVSTIWNKAKEIISEADEIWIIGYSFAAMDKESTIGLLAEAKRCGRGIIQNLPGEAERICEMLKTKHSELQIDWKPYPIPF